MLNPSLMDRRRKNIRRGKKREKKGDRKSAEQETEVRKIAK